MPGMCKQRKGVCRPPLRNTVVIKPRDDEPVMQTLNDRDTSKIEFKLLTPIHRVLCPEPPPSSLALERD